ncbi:amidohydrolase family protein [Mangrovivirga sp. M17]|uniref:Amidohydrolase family protein n=1 Tax=Mangrovivirga halotolerans TaxID=2993936 RepID=A0ABT3RPK8_9BACT|nr:amidohydrolase family protein [Mangrovivirga halotolerans]MCX2743726.1 amidohydrolase family protein [Mangrovivirga halotolerans]
MKKFPVLFLLSLLNTICYAQDSLSAEVQQYVVHDRGNYLLHNLTVLDGTGSAAMTNQDILIEGEYITQIGQDLSVPDNTIVINMEGKSAMPGMIMLHEHLFYPKNVPGPNYGLDQMTYSFPKLYLAGGVTTMRTAGAIMPQVDVKLKKWIKDGRLPGPTIDATSPHMDRKGLPILEMFAFDGPEQAQDQVDFYADLGITSIKVYNMLTREDLKAIIEAAHARNMKVTGHLCSITYREAVDLGIDNIEHGFGSCPDFLENKLPDQCNPFMLESLLEVDPDSENVTSLIDHMISNNVALTTTVNVFEPYTGREVIPGGGLEALSPRAKEKVYQRWVSKQGRDSIDVARFNKLKLMDKKFHDAGGLLVAGTDPTYDGRIVAGYANMRLLELMVEMGFSIPDAIMICTLNGAKYLESENLIGTIEEGKIADIIIMNDDISKDISAIRSDKIIFKNGIGYDSQKLFKAAEGLVGIR